MEIIVALAVSLEGFLVTSMMTTAGATRSKTLTNASLSCAAMLLAGDGRHDRLGLGRGDDRRHLLLASTGTGSFGQLAGFLRPAEARRRRQGTETKTANRGRERRRVMAAISDTLRKPATDECKFPRLTNQPATRGSFDNNITL